MSKGPVIGLCAHVDAGKTTLSESMLFLSGALRRQGRVDHGDTFLDTDPMEKDRGITIFSKEARLTWNHTDLTFLDTPGHTDFSGEMERALGVLDAAVLVISATDGVQPHTRTLWRLLEQRKIPVILFLNKTDLPHDPALLLILKSWPCAMKHAWTPGSGKAKSPSGSFIPWWRLGRSFPCSPVPPCGTKAWNPCWISWPGLIPVPLPPPSLARGYTKWPGIPRAPGSRFCA